MRVILLFLFLLLLHATSSYSQPLRLFPADDPHIEYTGRIDFSIPNRPRFWTAGVYIQAKFIGTTCELLINDEVLGGSSHNYLEIVIDDRTPFKIQTTGKTNSIRVAYGLTPGEHTLTICKNTEALIGYLEIEGLRCEGLTSLPPKPKRKIEFIGDSITSGTGSDLTPIPCDKAQWYDQHNAYFSYGPLVARSLNAQWHLTSDSGIGLIHSCCRKEHVMPELFDKVNLSKDSLSWDFSGYQPDVVTICLGQNDGIQDSIKFCNAYLDFISTIRSRYREAMIVCLTSPMAGETLRKQMERNLNRIVTFANHQGDTRVSSYFFSRSFNGGCGGHPDLNDHALIARELSNFLRSKMDWK